MVVKYNTAQDVFTGIVTSLSNPISLWILCTLDIWKILKFSTLLCVSDVRC